MPLYANILEIVPSLALVGSIRGDRPSSGGRMKRFRSRIQCQICGQFGHLAQRCFFVITVSIKAHRWLFNRRIWPLVMVLVCRFRRRSLVCFMVLPRRSCRILLWEEIFGRLLLPLCLDIIGFLNLFYRVLTELTVGPMLG